MDHYLMRSRPLGGWERRDGDTVEGDGDVDWDWGEPETGRPLHKLMEHSVPAYFLFLRARFKAVQPRPDSHPD